MTRTKKCLPNQHHDRYLRGRKRVECQVCGDQFPCLLPCDHRDCNWVKSDEIPLDTYITCIPEVT